MILRACKQLAHLLLYPFRAEMRFAKLAWKRLRQLQGEPPAVACVFAAGAGRHVRRDFLLWLHTQAENLSNRPDGGNTLDVGVVLPASSCTRTTDFVEAFALCPVAGDLHLLASPEELLAHLPFLAPEREQERLRRQGLQPADALAETVHRLPSQPRLNLRVTRDRKVAANDFLKSLGPSRQTVALHADPASALAAPEWLALFSDWQQQHHEVVFLLLEAAAVADVPALRRLRNVVNVSTLGFGFLDQFAMAQAADAYVGTFGAYALAALASQRSLVIADFPGADSRPAPAGERPCRIFCGEGINPEMLRRWQERLLEPRYFPENPAAVA
jgi:hypothetical protein